MYVYLKFGSLIRVVSNVTIDDDCGPVVEGKLIRTSDGNNDSVFAFSRRSTLDAISWFKSLPIESVYVDCNLKDARWCVKQITIPDSNLHEESKSDNSVANEQVRFSVFAFCANFLLFCHFCFCYLFLAVLLINLLFYT